MIGVIYESDDNLAHKETAINASSHRNLPISRVAGKLMAGAAMASILFTYSPLVRANLPNDTNVIKATNTENVVNNEQVSSSKSENSDIFINIPKIAANALIIKDVDPFNKKEYEEALKRGVAQATGTGLPGEGKTIYLFAHSTSADIFVPQYNAVFYKLEKLAAGDTIELKTSTQSLIYEVKAKAVVAANDTSFLTPSDGEKLILQTCYPPGTSFERLLIFADPVDNKEGSNIK